MSLENLTIQYEVGQKDSFSGEIKALFNPNQLTYTRSASWSPIHAANPKDRAGFQLLYQSTPPETLAVELFFDTYATNPESEGGLLGLSVSVSVSLGPISASLGPTATSVLPHTDAVASLARVDAELHRPPVCRLRWGEVVVFQGVLQQATRTLLMFLEDGTPVRATVNCTFMEVAGDGGTAAAELHSPDVAKRYVVRPGDTLMGISAAMYGDTSLWRRIADANRVEDPRRLLPGQTLTIPRIR